LGVASPRAKALGYSVRPFHGQKLALSKNVGLKAGIGQTGPLLFKLPQSLSQWFYHLVRAPF
jgi:hypothetical protein